MSWDNGIESNVQVKIFDGTQKMFWPFWFHLKALLMTKDQLDVLLPELKNKLPDSEYLCQWPTEERERKRQKEQNGCGILRNNIEFPEMDE